MATDSQISSAPLSGMRDFTPAEVRLRDWATQIITATYERFGFTKIETPCLENIQLLKRGEGGENLQLIFEVLKRGDKLDKVLSQAHSDSSKADRSQLSDMGLRFDLTVPLVRFYSHNQNNLPNPFKSIQIGSVWRAESAQQGRFRQFTQCDIDIFGVKNEIAEIELLQATSEALVKLGFDGFTILINDRRMLSGIAKHCGFAEERFDSVFIALDKLDKIGLEGVVKELSKDGHPETAIIALNQLLLELAQNSDQLNFLAEKISADEEVMKLLKNIVSVVSKTANGKFKIEFEPSLVRGMGYYTGPIFEIRYPGYNYSVAGGGRYDKMVGKMSGRDVPACGFSIGFERIIGILSDKQFVPPSTVERIALIFDSGRDDLAMVAEAATILREKYSVITQAKKKDVKKQIDSLPAQQISKMCMFRGDVQNLEVKDLT
ncbi:MAG: histidine--tRNA ligase [Candidatus Obscuribacterales bacterium]|jgi:histidyl-tRNA synthetase